MRRILIKELIDGLKDLASYDFQKAAWFENDLGLCWSWEETVSSVFNDNVGFREAYEEGLIVFDQETGAALHELEGACDASGYEVSEKEIIDSARMAVVRKMAKNCLRMIRSSDRSQSDVEFYETDYKPSNVYFPDRDEKSL
jgi:hypothetical protein